MRDPGTLINEDISGGAWLGDRLLFARAPDAAWSLDPARGALARVVATTKPNGTETQVDFLQDGRVIATSCHWCGEAESDGYTLANGARVVRDSGDSMYGHQTITLLRPDGTRRVLGETPPQVPDANGGIVVASCTPGVTALMGTLDDGRFLLYRIEHTYWLYGAGADKAIAVWRGASYLRW